ncbi:hypothetical protein C8R42DRAFT_638606 [Lentinula raphanica]|nr:hypothetical protein C8R42DRAFT_638606 [Lentinula raphanica]
MTTPRSHFRSPLRVIAGFFKRSSKTHRYFLQKLHSILCVPELKSLCGEVGQPRGGSKTVLLEQLKAFSGDTEKWKLLQPGARRLHKGSRTNENESADIEKKPLRKPSAYTQRRNAVFGDAQAGGPVQRLKDTWTDQEKAEMLAWAAEMSNEFKDFQTPRDANTSEPLFPTPAVRERKIESQLNTILDLIQHGTAVPTLVTEPVAHALPPASPSMPLNQIATSTAVDAVTLRRRLFASSSTSSLPDPVTSTQPGLNNWQPSLSAPSTFISSVPPTSILPSCPEVINATVQLPPVHSKAFHALRRLVLANGTVITFSPSTVPDPPLVLFAGDIEKLVRMWDDAAPDYRVSECALKVEGHGVPLRLWEEFVVEAFNRLGKDAFWAKYRNVENDKPMSYMAIVEELWNERKVNNALITAQVRDELSENFKDKFTYRSQQLVRPSAIAKRSQMLNVAQN